MDIFYWVAFISLIAVVVAAIGAMIVGAHRFD